MGTFLRHSVVCEISILRGLTCRHFKRSVGCSSHGNTSDWDPRIDSYCGQLCGYRSVMYFGLIVHAKRVYQRTDKENQITHMSHAELRTQAAVIWRSRLHAGFTCPALDLHRAVYTGHNPQKLIRQLQWAATLLQTDIVSAVSARRQ